jgi:hypothetical protein
LAPLLKSYELVSVDLHPPVAGTPAGEFIQLDLSSKAGQQELAQILRASRSMEFSTSPS